LHATVEGFAREIAALSQASIRGAKRAVAAVLQGDDGGLRGLVEAAALGEDFREGRAAFAGKRKPRFA
jgi:1,4-dihydroxy-2-naphthoyl-CoA synthase